MDLSEIKLTRAGHYFDAGNGACHSATIAHVFDGGNAVNLSVLSQDGAQFERTSVPVKDYPSVDDTKSSFHLSRACPFGK